MALSGGVVAVLWEFVVALFGTVVGILSKWVAWVGSVLGVSVSSLWGSVVTILGGLVGILWGGVLVVALFGAAVVLNAIGVDDVYGVLHRRIDRDDASTADHVEAVRNISAEEVTDDRGRFSSTAFERVTGMTPAEFVHLFVKSNGGRIKQQTLNTCLPWSNATVSHLLDRLERDGAIERIRSGRENVVCTPEAIPENRAQ